MGPRQVARRAVLPLLVLPLALAACSGSGGSPSPVVPSGSVVSGGSGTSGGSIAVPAAAGNACPAGDPGRLAGTRVAATAGVPRGPAPRTPFYVEPDSAAAQAQKNDPANAALYRKIADQSSALTVVGSGDVAAQVGARMQRARAAGATAVLSIYAIPHRDVGAGYSGGGLPDGNGYRTFTRQVAGAIGNGNAIVILETDALAQIDKLPADQQTERYALLNDAVDVYGTLPNTSVYLDGANCGWIPAVMMADRLKKAGIARARGFAVNVSNFYWTADELKRADVMSALTGGAHFVVDTSRNGRGPVPPQDPHHWCNPEGRGLGTAPTTRTGDARADAFLWIKAPGESDGECNSNEPAAGTWWPEQAQELARNSS